MVRHERAEPRHWLDKRWEESEPVGCWAVTPYLDNVGEYEEAIIAEGLQNVLWDNLYHCVKCFPDRDCARRGGMTRTIFGRECEGLCVGRRPFCFYDPDEAAVDCIKRLLELEERARE